MDTAATKKEKMRKSKTIISPKAPKAEKGTLPEKKIIRKVVKHLKL
jgi:hypothetical protein